MKPEDECNTEEVTENAASDMEEWLLRFQHLAGVKGIVLPTKPKQKAEMPTITVEGTPLSQMIVEDRR